MKNSQRHPFSPDTLQNEASFGRRWLSLRKMTQCTCHRQATSNTQEKQITCFSNKSFESASIPGKGRLKMGALVAMLHLVKQKILPSAIWKLQWCVQSPCGEVGDSLHLGVRQAWLLVPALLLTMYTAKFSLNPQLRPL